MIKRKKDIKIAKECGFQGFEIVDRNLCAEVRELPFRMNNYL